jgi:hypothetical protein
VGYTSSLGDGEQIRILFNSKALPKLNLEGLFLFNYLNPEGHGSKNRSLRFLPSIQLNKDLEFV